MPAAAVSGMQQVSQVTLNPPVPGGPGPKIVVVIPTMNEPAIGDVVRETRQALAGRDFEIVIVDKSADDTPERASMAGARVIAQQGTGYGAAYIEGFRSLPPDAGIVVMIDGDNTYDPHDIPALLAPVVDGKADIVLGNRFARMDRDAMTLRNRLGNRVITGAINLLFGLRLKDTQTGLRALRARALRGMEFESDGMPFASEMIISARNQGLTVVEVPASYRVRVGQAKMKAYRDGSLIIGLIILMAQRHNPLAIMLPVGGLLMLGGLALWAFVFYEWLSTGIINRLASVAGGTLLLLTGLQVIIFGVLAGILVTLHVRR
ncbi:MAG: Glycosyltransferase AglJ [Methanocella sp. PtaU1.Bin125]|nr:MAG: Glycosyltransferase AglJ [Methanocella sp. PtaU1.Bin125]